MNKISVIMATHIKSSKKPFEYILPMHVGAVFVKEKFFHLTDATFDNISNKNKEYCELTSLYWIWKNSSDKYVGLCHYRRFFNLEIEQVSRILESDMVIVPYKSYLGKSIEGQYKANHPSKIWGVLIDVLEEYYPDYFESANGVFRENIMYPFNMMICEKVFLDKYCNWLFEILGFVELKVDLDTLDDYQKRYAGFLAERLFTLYILHNKVNVKEVDLIDNNKKSISQSYFRRLRNNVHFSLWRHFN